MGRCVWYDLQGGIMEKVWVYYYLFLAGLIVAAVLFEIVISIANTAKVSEHYIGVNLTKTNGTCKVIWLGGWDFDSFYGNVTVNGVNAGHPRPVTEIFNETCKDIVVLMYDRAVKTDIELYRYNHTGVV
jgi:hypothetical protein